MFRNRIEYGKAIELKSRLSLGIQIAEVRSRNGLTWYGNTS